MLTTGRQAEDYAGKWLKNKRLSILESNYHSRWGEIDIVAMDDNTICFIEVRYRKSNNFGTAAESVTSSKQQRIIRTAHAYLHEHRQYITRPARFDVITLTGSLDKPVIDWYKDAFIMNAS